MKLILIEIELTIRRGINKCLLMVWYTLQLPFYYWIKAWVSCLYAEIIRHYLVKCKEADLPYLAPAEEIVSMTAVKLRKLDIWVDIHKSLKEHNPNFWLTFIVAPFNIQARSKQMIMSISQDALKFNQHFNLQGVDRKSPPTEETMLLLTNSIKLYDRIYEIERKIVA